jgi:ribonuclease BN (tRNA processing enzyme)
MAGVRILFLGTGDAFGSGGRLQASILLQANGYSALLDCGATTLVGLKRAGIDPSTIDAAIISHLHGDHFGGLPFLLLDGQFTSRDRALLIAGPTGTRERLRETMEALFPGSSRGQRPFAVSIAELAASETASIGPLNVMPFEVIHASGAPALALRIAIDDRVVAYSGDTEWCDNLVAVSAGANLFICEAYFYEKHVPFHLSYRTFAEHRAELTAKRILLTHMSADMLARLAETDVETAWDGLSVRL